MTSDSTFNRKDRKVLGKGLASLLPEANDNIRNDSTNVDSNETYEGKKKEYYLCSIDKLVPNAHQPRQMFDEVNLKELSASIKEHGVLQPIVVRRRGDSFEIVAGERRWRASKLAGLKEVPIIIKDISDRVALQTALVENIQRADLNSIEEARAYKQLVDEYSMTQENVAIRVGKDRSTITNYLRLLNLPAQVQSMILDSQISMGHAKVLCSLESEEMVVVLANEILLNKLSVRETEDVARSLKSSKEPKETQKVSAVRKNDEHFVSIEDRLRQIYKTKIKIAGKQEKGKFIIEYFNKDDFERILSILSRSSDI